MQTFQTEQNVRMLINEQLKNLGWNLKHGKNCNVYVENPRTREEKKKLKGKRPDYVLYSKDKNVENPLIIIETKKPGINLNTALEQGGWYAEQLGSPMVFATDGIYYKTLHTKFHKPLYLNGEEVDELIREYQALKFLENNELDTISKEVKYSRQELIKIFEEANNLLRDEGLRAGIERFGEFSNILFLKLLGEIEDFKEEEGEKFLIDRYLRWNSWKGKKGNELLDFVNDTVLEKIGNKFGDKTIFSKLLIKNSIILKKIINKLEPLKLINIASDIKGDSFEYFLKQTTATKNDLGEYFTPRHVVKTMVKLVNPQYGEKIYDPFCGTGGLLIESFRHIYNNMPRNKKTLEILKNDTIYGNEITNTARITKMNMILAGDGHNNIQMKNSLKEPINSKYDIVITNMPYSQKTEYGSYYDLQTNKGDSVCIQHCIKAIDATSENGRMAVIVPEGLLFRKDMLKTREYLLQRCNIKSIISLPQGVFLPYTGVKTNILYCTDIKKKKKQNKLWYFEVKNDGYSLDSHRRKTEGKDDLKKLLEFRNIDNQEKQDILKIGFYEISMEEVRKNDLVLSGNRYKKITDYSKVKWTMVELGDQKYFEIQSGGTPSSKVKSYWDGDINWATLVDLPPENFVTELFGTVRKITKNGLDNSSAKLLPKNSVLVSSRATIGRIAIAKNEVATNQGFKNIVLKRPDKVNEKFLAFMMIKLRKEMEQLASGGIFKEISKSNFEKLRIPLPPIEIQQEIANELDSYQKIFNNAKEIVSVYKPQINIDKKWNFFEINEIAEIRPKKSEISGLDKNTEVSFVPMSSLNGHDPIFESEETKKISEVYQGYTYFKNGDVLLSKITPCFENGKSGIARNLKNGIGFGSTEFIVIRANLKKILPEWIYYFIAHQTFLDQGKQTMVGSAGQQRININFVKNYKIPVPIVKIQEKLISQINNERSLIKASIQLSKIMNNKIQEKLNLIWGE